MEIDIKLLQKLANKLNYNYEVNWVEGMPVRMLLAKDRKDDSSIFLTWEDIENHLDEIGVLNHFYLLQQDGKKDKSNELLHNRIATFINNGFTS